jgi:succinate dehydrogenase / fumarate reductase, iron-sulfur subunit
MSRTSITLLIRRQDRPDSYSYWQEFEIPYEPQMNIISCLQSIAALGRTSSGEEVAPVVWDANCLEEVCGSCSMLVNGRIRQTCAVLVDNVLEQDGEPIRLEPMTKFPVVRDLMVNRTRMFENLKRIKGWIPVDGYYDIDEPPKVSPRIQEQRYPLSRCMTCGCCLEACPQINENTGFIGPAAIAQAMLFNLHPTGQNNAEERLDVMMDTGGIQVCGNAQNCAKVCPKGVPLLDAIGWMGRATTIYSIKRWFSR